MSSISNNHFRQILEANSERNYYDQLFSPDSTNTEIHSNHASQDNSTRDNTVRECFISNLQDILKTLDMEIDIDGQTKYFDDDHSSSMSYSVKEDTIKSDMSISTGDSMDISSIINEQSIRTSINDDDSMESIISVCSNNRVSLLKDDSVEIVNRCNSKLLYELHKNQKDVTRESPIETHTDIIGSFNIQNKYEHSIAARLFVDGQFSFLSLQEPRASHNKTQDSWKNCQRLELNSAAITCHETHHQIILYDSWKWGGKVISDFHSELDGRIAHIAFKFDGEQILGIISVYALARGGDGQEKERKEELRRTTVILIQRQMKKWKKKFPTIQIMILGDMQETESMSDLDNLGTTRFNNTRENGILRALQDSHTSVVRDRHDGDRYLTRFGREGARGIDHILFPNGPEAQALIHNASIDNELASLYFPSDHKLIKCSYIRSGDNNAESSEPVHKYSFGAISKIKMKREIHNGIYKLSLDESQFKGSDKFSEQKELLSRVQNLTGENGEMTECHITKLEQRIAKLYASLWEAGKEQGCCGEDNKLVDISEKQAAELSKIYNDFDLGVKDTMDWLHLVKESNCIAQKAVTRNNVRLKGDFKIFSNLPISTKLRYLRKDLQVKSRRIRKYINSIKEHVMKQKRGIQENFDTAAVFRNWKNTLSDRAISERAKTIYLAVMKECEERTAHMDAIQSMTTNPIHNQQSHHIPSSKKNNDNILHFLPKSTVWLSESDCTQGFSTSTSSDVFLFLGKDGECGKWTEKLISLNDSIHKENPSTEEMMHIQQELEDVFGQIHQLENRVSTSQRKYRMETIRYLMKTNKIENFTKKINPKTRESPTTHTEIWDSKLSKFRTCRNETEELIATGEFHGKWMSNSAASETCAFAKIKSKGLLGARGVILSQDRKVGFSDIPKLIKNGDKLPLKLKRAFIAAHGAHTSKLFRPPKKEHKALYYPFFLKSYDGEAHCEENLAEMFWKSLTAIPGKARYDGYHMSIIGRFGYRWQKCLFDIVKLILLMRFIPRRLKKVARFPIPKPGRVNEYRPISLCHDVYCFINAISTTYSSKGIQESNILHEGITAYVKGKGCSTLVGVEQSIREDCVESGVPMSQTDEDEEKFFDRIPVEVLLAAMRVNGFPEQGFLELKASGMEAKTVEIITGKGIAHARLVCGLEQGNPDSPTISNLVIKFKHDIWRNLLKEIKTVKLEKECKTENQHTHNKDAYRFHVIDSIDGPVIVDRIGYCDDNTRYTTSLDEKEVIATTRHYIQQAGDLSMVTKIGRKGSKSEVHYFNLSAKMALSLKRIETTAWSFTKDAPTTESVPFKIALRQKELDQVLQITNFSELSKDEQDEMLRIFKAKPHKHLGLRSTISGNAEEASLEVIRKIKARLVQLRVYSLEKEAQQLCCNMLCTTMHSYAPLQMAHDPTHLTKCDNLMINQIAKRHGLSGSDAKHALFIHEKDGGYGFKSFLDVDITSTVREVEIILNGWMLDSRATRSRLKSYSKYVNLPNEELQHANHIGVAIRKIARYGFHIRDVNEGILNYVLCELNKRKSYVSLGSELYNDSSKCSMGIGKTQNLDLAYGSILHSYLKKHIGRDGTWTDTEEDNDQHKILPVAKSTLQRTLRKVRNRLFEDTVLPYNCWEWCIYGEDGIRKNNIEDNTQWRFINVVEILKSKFPKSYWNLPPTFLIKEAEKILNDAIVTNKNLQKHIRLSQSPPIFATDGSHHEDNEVTNQKRLTSGAAVLCLLDIRRQENLGDEMWTDRQVTPVLARASRLPLKYGNQQSDIGHGEGTALCLGLEMMNEFKGGIIVMDSQAVRDVAVSLRDRKEVAEIDRHYIKGIASGISKHICSRISRALSKIHNSHEQSCGCRKIRDFIRTCKKWGNENTQENQQGKKWDQSCINEHPYVPILKVDSHQLNREGNTFGSKKRYDKLIPCLSLLNSNHHADRCAARICSDYFKGPPDTPNLIHLPESELRFSITWNGMGIDKHVSEFVIRKIQLERIKRLKLKATQGLPWRVMENSSMTWKKLKQFPRLRRSVCGLSRTHTRSLYKSDVYRDGQRKEKLNHAIEESPPPTHQTKQKLIEHLKPCTWCDNKACAHGNRIHAMFFCKRREIFEFRLKMSQLLEKKLFMLVTHIGSTTNDVIKETFLKNVESTMVALHGEQRMDKDDAHMRYRTRETWLLEENSANWQELVDSTIPIYSHIFGFTPVMEINMQTGFDLNQALCIPLGIASKEIDRVIDKLGSTYLQIYSNSSLGKTMKNTLSTMWEEVKEINMARAMGLHSIIGVVSKKFEAIYRKNVRTNNTSVITSVSNNIEKETHPILRKRTREAQEKKTGQERQRKKVRFEEDRKETKLCKGVTCATIIDKGHFLMTTPNTILNFKKHCQRCSRQITALRCGADTLHSCVDTQQLELKKVVDMMDNQKEHRVDYKGIMELLPTLQAKNKDKRKQRCTDGQKTTMKTIQTWITRVTDKTCDAKMRINEAVNFMEKAIVDSNKFLRDDSKHSMQIEKALPEVKSCIQKQTKKINSNGKQQEVKETVWISSQEEKFIRLDKKETLQRGRYMSDRTMSRAINNMRIKLTTSEIFIATPMASSIIAHWDPSQGWEEFAKIFRSIRAVREKPNGYYLIPIFTGEARDGHWSFAMIYKAYRDCRGWMMDSLGTGGTRSDTATKIKKAFSKNRLKCKWVPVKCQAQQEVECGPRTVWGMVSICQAIRDEMPVEDIIAKATLRNSVSMYDPEVIRRKAATLIDETAEVRERIKEDNVKWRRYWNRRRRERENPRNDHSSNAEIETIVIDG